jgi:hypothetical protein
MVHPFGSVSTLLKEITNDDNFGKIRVSGEENPQKQHEEQSE